MSTPRAETRNIIQITQTKYFFFKSVYLFSKVITRHLLVYNYISDTVFRQTTGNILQACTILIIPCKNRFILSVTLKKFKITFFLLS